MSADIPIVFGLETEFGITREVEPNEELDVVAESIALVRANPFPAIRMRWDYRFEDPHADARGFRVAELRQDFDESNYTAADAARPLSFPEIKSDLVLANGARFYNDHAHPEYCTPECSTPDEVLLHDRVGELIVRRCAKVIHERHGTQVRLYKNNTDFRGHSYGCHENYLLPRALPWEKLAIGAQAFLVARQVFTGAGKFGFEDEDRFLRGGFQLSQRADFFTELQSVDTMQRRPIINTRDEPHANAAHWRRFHVIIGDSNMSPFATRLKVGTTALVLQALSAAHAKPHLWEMFPRLTAPIRALKAISHDPSLVVRVELRDGKTASGLDILGQYLRFVREALGEDLGEWREAILEDWAEVLRDLREDPELCADRLDWVAKRMLVRQFQAEHSLESDDPWLRSLDLAYSDLDLDEGLYSGLEATGMMRAVPDTSSVTAATTEAPSTTRAAVRGRLIAKFGSQVTSAQWDHVTLSSSLGPVRISLMDLFAPAQIAAYLRVIEQASTVEALRELSIS